MAVSKESGTNICTSPLGWVTAWDGVAISKTGASNTKVCKKPRRNLRLKRHKVLVNHHDVGVQLAHPVGAGRRHYPQLDQRAQEHRLYVGEDEVWNASDR